MHSEEDRIQEEMIKSLEGNGTSSTKDDIITKVTIRKDGTETIIDTISTKNIRSIPNTIPITVIPIIMDIKSSTMDITTVADIMVAIINPDLITMVLFITSIVATIITIVFIM
jgi:hypothetical protein